MNANERRILFKLWKDRHTHPGGELQEIEQRLIRVETGLDPVATQSGAHIHLLGGSQTVDAEAIDWDALLALPLATAIPAFPTSEVTISQGGYYPFYVHIEFDDWFQGGDIWITRTRAGVTSQVWPPSGASDLWSSPGGSRFTDIAPAIDCEPGDVYQLWVDCGEEVMVKRAVFVPWLADRGLARPPGGGDLLVFTESGSHDFGAGAVYDLFLLAGGGAGGGSGSSGGGGGAGGLLKVPGVVLSGLQEFTVGGGGTASSGLPGGDGGDTTIASYTAKGGGGGGVQSATESVRNGRPGGCGGGGGARITFPAAGIGGQGVDGQGNDGGNGYNINSCLTAGGGGGVAGPGGDATGCGTGGGVGGDGVDLSHIVGTDYGDGGVFGKGGSAEINKSPVANSGNGGALNRDGSSGIIICAPPGSI